MNGTGLPNGLLLRLYPDQPSGTEPERYGPGDTLPKGVSITRAPEAPTITVDTNQIRIDIAKLSGPGAGTIVVTGDNPGSVERRGSGEGNAIRTGSGAGDAIRTGSGTGSADRSNDGDGAAARLGNGRPETLQNKKQHSTLRKSLQYGAVVVAIATNTFLGSYTGRAIDKHVETAARTIYETAELLRSDAPRGPPTAERQNSDSPYPRVATDELDVLLDSMLISNHIPAGTPLEERIGEIPNARILEVIRDIDDTLGGRVEWPNVYVEPDLTASTGALGVYRHKLEAQGPTVDATENIGRDPKERWGITIDRDFATNDLDGEVRNGRSLKQLLVHELQHATSSDNAARLVHAARSASQPYDQHPEHDVPHSEGRAEMAKLLFAELEDRKRLNGYALKGKSSLGGIPLQYDGGPKLNELDASQRAEVVRGVLTKFLDPENSLTQPEADKKLRDALRDEKYVWQRGNSAAEVLDAKTLEHMQKSRRTSDYLIHLPAGTSLKERFTELGTPLDKLSEQYAAQRAERATRHGSAQPHAEHLHQRGDRAPTTSASRINEPTERSKAAQVKAPKARPDPAQPVHPAPPARTGDTRNDHAAASPRTPLQEVLHQSRQGAATAGTRNSIAAPRTRLQRILDQRGARPGAAKAASKTPEGPSSTPRNSPETTPRFNPETATGAAMPPRAPSPASTYTAARNRVPSRSTLTR